MFRDTLGRFSTDKKEKMNWIGKRLFVGAIVALIGSMLLEMFIYTSAAQLTKYIESNFIAFR